MITEQLSEVQYCFRQVLCYRDSITEHYITFQLIRVEVNLHIFFLIKLLSVCITRTGSWMLCIFILNRQFLSERIETYNRLTGGKVEMSIASEAGLSTAECRAVSTQTDRDINWIVLIWWLLWLTLKLIYLSVPRDVSLVNKVIWYEDYLKSSKSLLATKEFLLLLSKSDVQNKKEFKSGKSGNYYDYLTMLDLEIISSCCFISEKYDDKFWAWHPGLRS